MIYELKLHNEVEIVIDNLINIFKTKQVFVLGYGSLLYSKGWQNRGMRNVTEPKDLQECWVSGYERGQFGHIGGTHYYGVVENKDCKFNGVLNRIHTLEDWIGLMCTEAIAGLFDFYNYRVVDVTDKISGVKLPKNAVVHMVANEPKNKIVAEACQPAKGYYERVFNGVLKERTTKFILEFIKTGGMDFNKIDASNNDRRKIAWYRGGIF